MKYYIFVGLRSGTTIGDISKYRTRPRRARLRGPPPPTRKKKKTRGRLPRYHHHGVVSLLVALSYELAAYLTPPDSLSLSPPT